MEILQEVYLSNTVGTVAPLLLNALSLAGVEEIWVNLTEQKLTLVC